MDERATIIILGAGGHAREVLWMVQESTALGAVRVAGFAVTESVHGRQLEGLPVMQLGDASALVGATHYVSGIGNPRSRQRVSEAADRLGLQPLTIVHPTARVAPGAIVEEGAVLFAYSVVSAGARIFRHAHLNFAASVSHDSRVGAYALVSPGVRIAGNAEIGERVFIGIGASVSNGTSDRPLRVGADAVVGAGSTVLRDVEGGTTVAGTPAKLLHAGSGDRRVET